MAQVAGLDDEALQGVWDWHGFFAEHEVYRPSGRVAGRWFDGAGTPLQQFPAERLRRRAEAEEARKQRLPDCNSRWSQKAGAEVWCSTLSGGVRRAWAGVPRLYNGALDPQGSGARGGAAEVACVCAPPELTDARQYLKPYEGCEPTAERCAVRRNIRKEKDEV